ncbi:unknown [Clostridium sp. CAG:628]|nr:unknown [Clostridium sp. CAG:628]
MGLFKSLVEFSTKWKLIDKHGWGAGLLYEDEVNKRKLDKLDREYSNILEEGKRDYFKIGDDIIKNNKYITKEEKEELFSILFKIDNTNDSDLVIMLGNELKAIGRKIIFNNYIRDVLMQINDVVMNNEKVYPEERQTFLDYYDKINKVDDFTRKRYLIIELLDYLETNKIKITNRKEFTDGIDMLNKTFEEDK